MKGTPSIGLGAALSNGLRLSAAFPFFLFALMGARAVQAMVEASFAPALFAAEGPPLGKIGAAGALFLIAELAAACLFALAARAGAARLRGDNGLSSRWPWWALGYFLVGGAVMLAARLWVWTALGATFTAWLRALLLREGGVGASFALALALAVSLILGLFATLWIRVGLARAAAREEGYLVSLHDAAGSLRARLGPPLSVLLITGLAGALLEGAASAILLPLSPRFDAAHAQEVRWAVGMVSGALGALGVAFAQLWGLLALTALQADEAGQLSAATPPPVVPVAALVSEEPIPMATVVEPPPPPVPEQ